MSFSTYILATLFMKSITRISILSQIKSFLAIALLNNVQCDSWKVTIALPSLKKYYLLSFQLVISLENAYIDPGIVFL